MPNLLEYYEDLHRVPELSGKEEKTKAYLMAALTDMGYQPVGIGK